MVNALVEINSCQVCGSHNTVLMFEESPYRVMRCSDCGFVYITPRLHVDCLHEVFNESYWQCESPTTRGYAYYRSDEPMYMKTFERACALSNATSGLGGNGCSTSGALRTSSCASCANRDMRIGPLSHRLQSHVVQSSLWAKSTFSLAR